MLRYCLDREFGISGIVFGILFITLGCFTIFTSWSGIILWITGTFWIFTISSCKIDTKNFRISFPFELFGIFHIGKWIYVRPDMLLGILETPKSLKIKCSSGRIVDVSGSKYLIFLYDENKKARYLILKTKSKEKAEDELARLSDLLGIHVKENQLTKQNKVIIL